MNPKLTHFLLPKSKSFPLPATRNGSKITCRRTLRKHIQIMPKVVRRLLLEGGTVDANIKAAMLKSMDELRHLLETRRAYLLEIYKERGGLSGFALNKATKRKRTSINHLLNFVGQPSLKEEYTDFAAHNAEREKRLTGGQREHRGCRSIDASFDETPADPANKGHPLSAVSASSPSSSSMAAALWPASSAPSMACYGGSAAMPLRAQQGANQFASPDRSLLKGGGLSEGGLQRIISSFGGVAASSMPAALKTATANAGEHITVTTRLAPSSASWPSSLSSCPVLPSYSEQLALAKVLSTLATAGSVESRGGSSSNGIQPGNERTATAQEWSLRCDAPGRQKNAITFQDPLPGGQHYQGTQQQLQHVHVPPYGLYTNCMLPNFHPAIAIPPLPASHWLPSHLMPSSSTFLKATGTLHAAMVPTPFLYHLVQGLPEQSAPPRME